MKIGEEEVYKGYVITKIKNDFMKEWFYNVDITKPDALVREGHAFRRIGNARRFIDDRVSNETR